MSGEVLGESQSSGDGLSGIDVDQYGDKQSERFAMIVVSQGLAGWNTRKY